MYSILLLSILFALSTFLHNKLYLYNKTLFAVLIVMLISTISYKLLPENYWALLHVITMVISVWALIIYTFLLKKEWRLKTRRRSDV